MAANFEYSMIPSGAQEHCFPELLKVADNKIGNLALCFPKYSRLDGSVKNAAKQEIAGWVSKKMSDKNGSFSTYPSMTLKFARAKNCSGISLSFNRTSGDFANFRILWMDASGTVLKSESCSPADPEVSVFTELSGIASVRLTFQSTNRPYRPVFLERVEFLNLRAYESFKLVYDELAPGAAENAVFSSTAKRPEITELSWLTSGESQNLALCLPKYSRLDGTFRNYSSSKMAGWVSQAISDSSGAFASAPALHCELGGGYYSSAGIHIRFGPSERDYCSSITIDWYNGDTVLASQDFTPDSNDFFCEKSVENYTGIQITCKKTNFSYRPAVIRLIEFGHEIVYTTDHVDGNEILSEVSLLSDELTVNTADFTLRVMGNVSFQRRQQLTAYYDNAVQGVFYTAGYTRSGTRDYDVTAQDATGLLEEDYYGTESGNLFLCSYNDTVSSVVGRILQGTGLNYQIAAGVASANVKGVLPACTRREALQQVCYAAGAICNTFGGAAIRIVPLDTTGTPVRITQDKISISSLSIEDLDEVSRIVLTCHNYVKTSEGKELYRGKLSAGKNSIVFSGPSVITSTENVAEKYSAAITNAAYVTPLDASKECVLYGYDCTDNTSEVTKYNPKYEASGKTEFNVIQVQDAYFVHTGNAAAVLQRTYDYYQRRHKITAKTIDTDVSPGTRVTIDTYDGAYTGNVERVSSRYSGSVFREIVVR